MQDVLRTMTFSTPDPDWPKPTPDAAGKVNVVMRTRDRPLLMRRACETVLAQTYTDWSLVLVNDGGPASEVEACLAPYRQLFGDRLEIRHNPVCLGRAKAANIGLQGGVGEFVAFLDDDDTWSPDFLKETIACLRTPGNERLGGVASRARLVSERIENGEVLLENEVDHSPDMSAVSFSKLLVRDHIPFCSLVFRRAALDVLGGLNEALWTLGDWEFLTRLSCLCEIGVVPKALAYRHRRTNLQGTPYANSRDCDVRRQEEALVRNQALRRSLADTSRPAGGLLEGNPFLVDVLGEVEALKRELAELRAVVARQDALEGALRRLRVLEELGAAQARSERLLREIDQRLERVDERAGLLASDHALLNDLAQGAARSREVEGVVWAKVRDLHLWVGILTWPLRAVWRPLRRAALGLVGKGGGGHAS